MGQARKKLEKDRLLIVLAILLFSLLAYGDKEGSSKVTIAVIDTPVDLEHEMLAPFVDEEVLERLKFTDRKGNLLSWRELNEQGISKYLERLENKAEYELARKFLVEFPALWSFRAFIKSSKPVLLVGIVKMLFSSNFRRMMGLARAHQNSVTELQHGTHVAGIAVRGLQNVKLITFPLLRKPREYSRITLRSLKNFDFEAHRMKLRGEYEELSKGLQEAGARVVNLSFGFSLEEASFSINQKLGLVRRILDRQLRRQRYAEKITRIRIEEMERFFLSNPNIAFVMAAGNSGADLSDDRVSDSAKIKAPNLVKVGAVDKSGKLAKFSNTSKWHVDLAAPGVDIESAKAGGGTRTYSGTSMASPAVMNRLAEILGENPGFTAVEAIDHLLEHETETQESLKYQVGEGRVLSLKIPAEFRQEKFFADFYKDYAKAAEAFNELGLSRIGNARCSAPLEP